LHRCVVNYLKSWFPLDVSIVVLDWILLITAKPTDEAVSAARMKKPSALCAP